VDSAVHSAADTHSDTPDVRNNAAEGHHFDVADHHHGCVDLHHQVASENGNDVAAANGHAGPHGPQDDAVSEVFDDVAYT